MTPQIAISGAVKGCDRDREEHEQHAALEDVRKLCGRMFEIGVTSRFVI